MQRPAPAPLFLLLGIAFTQYGCVTAEVRLTSFMTADRGPRTAVLTRGYAVQDLVIHRADRLIGITHAHHPGSRAVIVFCGGDTFRRSIEGGDALEALARESDVVLFDYPGRGDSTGTPSASTVLETALAVYDYAAALETSAGKKRVLYGFSLGAMVAAQVAQDRAVDGLILEASARDVESWARSQIPWYARALFTARVEPGLASIDSVAALSSYSGEVLVLSGEHDRQAPAELSEQLHRALKQAGVRAQRVHFRQAGHGQIVHDRTFAPVLHGFLQRVQLAPDQRVHMAPVQRMQVAP